VGSPRGFVAGPGESLLPTGLVKVFSAINPVRALDTAEPLIGMPFCQLLLLVWEYRCGWIGSLAGVLHLSDQGADAITKAVHAYLLVGS
jgi:hypothetical protein